jgi:GT2 family glycosyltransferase
MLDSVAQQTEKPFEIIIVDSSDESLDNNLLFVRRRELCKVHGIHVIYCHTHERGASLQRNRALDMATGDLCYFFDDDVILAPDYLLRMNNVFRECPWYAGGMGTVNSPKPRINWCRLIKMAFLLPRDGGSGKFTFSGMPTHAYGTNNFKNIDVLGGCCMCLRTTVVKQEKFDERLGAYSYMEDCDLSWRVSRKYLLFYNPAAKLEHRCSAQARETLVGRRALFIHNYSYLFFKNFYPQNKLKIVGYCWSIVGLFVEAMLTRKWAYLRGYKLGLRNFWSS